MSLQRQGFDLLACVAGVKPLLINLQALYMSDY